MEKFKIRFLKIENFKSYKKFLFVGPLKTSMIIIGKNGSGKTNLSDSIVFGLGGSLQEINCYSIQNLFPQFFGNRINHPLTKIGLSIVNRISNNFIRIISIDNLSEFFLNGIKISFICYKKSLKKLEITRNKDLLILKDLIRCSFFFSNFKLSELIDKISGSNKLSCFHLKVGLLRKKFKKNSFFYFQKLKFIAKEKNFLINRKSITSFLKKILSEYKEKQRNLVLFIIFCTNHKVWASLRKNNYKNKQKREIFIQSNCFFVSPLFFKIKFSYQFFKSLNLKNSWSKIFIFIIQTKILKVKIYCKIKNLLRKNYFTMIDQKKKLILTKIDIKDSFLPKKAYFLSNYIESVDFSSDKDLPNLNQKKKKFFVPILGKNVRCKTKLKENFSFNEDLLLGFNNFFFFDSIKKFFEKKKKNLFLIKRKVFMLFFYLMTFLLFTLLEIKKKKDENIISKNSKLNAIIYLSLKSSIQGVRGKLSEVFKPIDSKFKKIIQTILGEKKDCILVDNIKTVSYCLGFVEKRKNLKFFFISIRDIHGIYNFYEKKNLEEKDKLTGIVDYDGYDLDIISFFSKNVVIFNMFNQNISFKFFKDRINIFFYKNIAIQKSDLLTITFNPEKIQKKIIPMALYERLKKKKIFFIDRLNFLTFLIRKINLQLCKDIQRLEKIFIFSKNYGKKKLVFLSRRFFDSHKNCVKFLKKKKNCVKKSVLFTLQIDLFFLKFLHLERKKVLIFKNYRKKIKFWVQTRFSYIFCKSMVYLKNYKDFNTQTLDKKKKYFNLKQNLAKIENLSSFFKIELFFWKKIFINFRKEIKKREKFKKDCKTKRDYLVLFLLKMNDLYQKKNFLFIDQSFIEKKYNYKIRKLLLKLENIFFGSLFFFFLKCNWGKKNYFKITKSVNFFYFLNFFGLEKEVRNRNRKNITKKSTEKKKERSENKKSDSLKNRLLFVKNRYKLFKKKLIMARYRFLVSNSKYQKIGEERKTRFKKCLLEISTQTNKIYKHITKSFLFPSGGSAFLTIENDDQPFYGKVSFTPVPPAKSMQKAQNMSGGEKTIAAVALIVGFTRTISQPFLLFDEVDSFLDLWYSRKFFSFLNHLSEKNTIQIFTITLKLKFFVFFKTLICIFRENFGSNLLTITYKEYKKKSKNQLPIYSIDCLRNNLN
ncbi:structural maintenance of chromosomes 1 (nucleomorph) [Chroomonas mesostigmatica CCMP1168]|uniref:Structural maintenance of chromosomes 1 n=1 Tax=Chroomonas mesostigmatica CCMP1168 TaxID=1195612 RepID=J7G891_9CRYP|nr:structural maintenance of chromosomes 1 [Chroomonas mesostigmatica CCMP1168]